MEDHISLEIFCASHEVDVAFVHALERAGLVEITIVEGAGFIEASRLADLEKWVRLHYDMDINMEGLEAIHGLLGQIESLQQELRRLQNKLEFLGPHGSPKTI